MRVKIGSEWHDSDEVDICVEFSESELDYVQNTMDAEKAPNRRFAVMTERGRTPDEMRAWIREHD